MSLRIHFFKHVNKEKLIREFIKLMLCGEHLSYISHSSTSHIVVLPKFMCEFLGRNWLVSLFSLYLQIPFWGMNNSNKPLIYISTWYFVENSCFWSSLIPRLLSLLGMSWELWVCIQDWKAFFSGCQSSWSLIDLWVTEMTVFFRDKMGGGKKDGRSLSWKTLKSLLR